MTDPQNAPVLYLVVPCYNEEALLRDSAEKLLQKLHALSRADGPARISADSRIVLVDDGSRDGSWQIMRALSEADAHFVCLRFTRNFGHQSAVLAGLMLARDARADVTVSIDADLQQDIDAIDLFLTKYREGHDIVYGVRNSRSTDGFFKRLSANLYYSLMKALGCDVLRNHADYRLMSLAALDALAQFEETNLFLRGIVPLCGFDACVVYFDVHERTAGESKYTLAKMLTLAANGITAFSIRPMHLIMALGLIVFVIAVILVIYCFIVYFEGKTVPGWANLTISTWALGGLQLLAIGCVGEYVGKAYMEAKRRPRYLIRERLGADAKPPQEP